MTYLLSVVSYVLYKDFRRRVEEWFWSYWLDRPDEVCARSI